MVLAYILSFLGALSWQWGAPKGNLAGPAVGIVLLIIAVIKTWSAIGGRYADKKELLLKLGGHAIIWAVVILLYRYVMGLLTIVCLLIGINIFTGLSSGQEKSGHDAEETGDGEFSLTSLPFIVYDDNNDQWKRRGIFGDHAVYYNEDGREVTIYSAQISRSTATTSAGNLHW